MLTRALALTIPGNPATKGSMKCVGARGKQKHALLDNHARTKPYVEMVAAAVRRAWPADERADRGQAVQVYATLTLPRPTYHYGTGRNAAVLKRASYTALPVGQGTGDIDKYLRALLDAAQAGELLPDDSQVVDAFGSKRYLLPARAGDVLTRPGVVIRVVPFELPTPDLTLEEG